jgi:septal ring factor EnvC (AmiA/AmiB activator)
MLTMEDLFGDNKLGQLEEKIEGLLKTYAGLKDERRSFTARIESLESENRELKEQMTRAENERTVITQKVKGILDKIEQIEV